MTHRDKSEQPQKHRHRKLSNRKLYKGPNRVSDIIITVCVILGAAIIVYLVASGASFGSIGG